MTPEAFFLASESPRAPRVVAWYSWHPSSLFPRLMWEMVPCLALVSDTHVPSLSLSPPPPPPLSTPSIRPHPTPIPSPPTHPRPSISRSCFPTIWDVLTLRALHSTLAFRANFIIIRGVVSVWDCVRGRLWRILEILGRRGEILGRRSEFLGRRSEFGYTRE